MKLLKLILLATTFLFIFISYGFSDQTATESLTWSDQVLEYLKLVEYDDIVNKTGNYQYYSRIIREVGHVVMYSLITLPIYLLILVLTKRNLVSVLITVILVMTYAYFDEYHQETIDGRGYEWLDLVLDFVGCSIVVLVASVVTTVNRFLDDYYHDN